jgi:hypothetical protein
MKREPKALFSFYLESSKRNHNFTDALTSFAFNDS